jgi:hypothetical protein
MMISSISTSQIASSLFSKLDTKSQGYIEKADLETAFSSISSDSDSTSVDDLFTALDSDSDGKVTEDEMSSGLDTLMSQLNSQFDSMRMQGGGQGMPPPPPPPSEGEDEGYTQDELTSIAASTDDSQLASLMTEISENFEAADTNQDGKVTGQEAMAYKDSSSSSSTSDSTSTSASNSMSQIGMPPPPPPSGGQDEGYTQDELTSIAASTDDSQLASLMTEISENFEAADTNQDGKVTGQEAMAYKDSSSSSDSTSTSSSTNSLSQIAQQIQQLITAYGLDSSSSSSLSYTA